MVRDVVMAGGAAMTHSVAACCAVLALLVVAPAHASAQGPPSCTFICELQWKLEPTFTIENLANRHRVAGPDGETERVNRERVFEMILALDMKTRLRWLGFTAEVSAAPFSDDNSAELEFETNFHWLTESMSRGWLTSHFDVVDQFSPAERPSASNAYTHKLDFELDTAFHLFKRLPEGRWLRGVELETSLDYLATGIPKTGDVFADGSRFVDDASHWSLSFVIVIPIAPF
jgi:hypothetical protein